MPMREYKCSSCGASTDELFKTTEKQPLTIQCPECGEEATMSMSRTSFILKGAGWYRSDYKPKGERNRSDDD